MSTYVDTLDGTYLFYLIQTRNLFINQKIRKIDHGDPGKTTLTKDHRAKVPKLADDKCIETLPLRLILERSAKFIKNLASFWQSYVMSRRRRPGVYLTQGEAGNKSRLVIWAALVYVFYTIWIGWDDLFVLSRGLMSIWSCSSHDFDPKNDSREKPLIPRYSGDSKASLRQPRPYILQNKV